MPNSTEKLDFGSIYDFRDFQKGVFWIKFSAERALKEHEPECWEASGTRPGTDLRAKCD